MLKWFMFAFLSLSPAAFAEGTSTQTETTTWKKVDKSLNDGVKTIKKNFLDAEDKTPPKKKADIKSENGKELEKITDSLNEVWDNSLKGVGKLLKTQQTNTATNTATGTH